MMTECQSGVAIPSLENAMFSMIMKKKKNEFEHEKMKFQQEKSTERESLEVSQKLDEKNESSTALHAALLLTSLGSNLKVLIPKAQNVKQDREVLPSVTQSSSFDFQNQEERSRDIFTRSNESFENGVFSNFTADRNLRIRAVSMDCSGLTCSPYESLTDYMNDRPTMVHDDSCSGGGKTMTISPPESPTFSGICVSANDANGSGRGTSKRRRSKSLLDPRKRFCLRKQQQEEEQNCKEKKKKLTDSKVSPALHSKIHERSSFTKGKLNSSIVRPIVDQRNTTILRRKFSWKNYPELESFLIANREEYLRHSALNYTTQQKQYNNRLTERLIELASAHGYIFDEKAFSFVTVRDRIRCYYKSYVQSSKKRGLIIGYAARKAGLLSEDELERSAAMEGRIVVPEAF